MQTSLRRQQILRRLSAPETRDRFPEESPDSKIRDLQKAKANKYIFPKR